MQVVTVIVTVILCKLYVALFCSGPNHDSKFDECCDKFTGDARRVETGDEDNYSQVTTFWTKVRLPPTVPTDYSLTSRQVPVLSGRLSQTS